MSHPPTISRIDFIERRPRLDPAIVLNEAESRAIDDELRPLFERMSMKLMDDFRLY